MTKLTQTQETLLALTAASLFGKQLHMPADVDWQALLTESRYQSVTLLVYSAVKSYLPPDVKAQWEQACLHIAGSNARVDWEHAQLHRIMYQAEIPYMVMKGCASASYYPDPSARTMGDVDFLVLPEDLEPAGHALEQAGFALEQDAEEDIHLAYHRGKGANPSVWEMHWEPNGIPAGQVGEKIRVLLKSAVLDAQMVSGDNCSYMGPTKFYHGLILLLHTAEHMINTGIGLRHLCDWAVFVAALDEREFTEIFEEKLKSVGLWRFAQMLTQVSTAYLGCPEKKWAKDMKDADLKPIIADILAGGNFGRKDGQRINQAKLMTNKARGTVDDTPIAMQFIYTMNEKARRGLALARKCPLLLPIGWLYVGARHLLRIATGKRPKIKLSEMISGANERKEIYKQFKLFSQE